MWFISNFNLKMGGVDRKHVNATGLVAWFLRVLEGGGV